MDDLFQQRSGAKTNTMRIGHLYYFLLTFSSLVIFSSCSSLKHSSASNTQEGKIRPEKIYAIKNVNVIPMTTGGKIIGNATVVIKGNKIFSINDSIPDEAIIID